MQPNPQMSPTTIVIQAKKASLGPQLINPRAKINGHQVPLVWGRNEIPAPAGVHHVQISYPWLWEQGKAEISIDNTYGPAPEIYYAQPFTAFHKGAIGHQPVKSPGLLAMILVVGGLLAFAAACCGIAAFADAA